MEIDQMLANVAKKSGESVDKLRAEYNVILEKTPPGKNREMNAIKALNREYAVGRSPAVSFDGIVVGIGQLGDYNKNIVAQAMEAYNNDPADAVQRGLVQVTDGQVTVLDSRQTFASGKENNNFGKPLRPGHNRSCVCLAKEEGGAYKLCALTLQAKHAVGDLMPVTNALLRFRALGSIEEGLRTSDAATKFETLEVLSAEKVSELLMEHAGDHMKMLGDCMDYHRSIPEKTPEFYGRFVVTSGNVAFSQGAKEGKETAFMVLDDPTVESTVSCFVPNFITLPEQGTEITVIAQTNIGKKWDTEKKAQTDEDALQLNVMGIIPS